MTARVGGIDAVSLPDMERRIANMVRDGAVMAINHSTRRVRVKSGDIETDWLPWTAGRSGPGKRRWDPPEVGEQVTIICPSGDLRQGRVVPGFYQGSYDAPSSNPDADRAEYGDGTVVEYDRGSHTLLVDLGDSKITMNRAKIELTIGATTLTLTAGGTTLETPQLTVDAPQSTFTGQVNVQGLLTYSAGLAGSGGSGATMTGPITQTGGNVSLGGGSLTHNSKNVGSTHTHSGVQTGGGNSGAPT